MRPNVPILALGLALTATPAAAQSAGPRVTIREGRAYQGRTRNSGPEQTDRFSRKVRLGRDGRVTIGNISGDITVSAGSGDEVSIDAVKRGRDQGQVAAVQIVVDERPGRVDVRTEYDSHFFRNNNVSVDYIVTMPATASIDAKSISGNVKVSGIQGAVRVESISGTVTTATTPKLEMAKSVSGDVDLTSAASDADLNASTVSGDIRAKGLKARGLTLGTVSGDVTLTDVACERLNVKSVSGNVEYAGALAKSGRYDVNSHSGTVRLALAGGTGFELNASTFSGSIRSELPLTVGGTADARGRDDRRRGVSSRAMQATFGDGSAALTIRTFSGDIVITKR